MTTWIFQGNPKEFQINEYLRIRNKQLITWEIKQKHFKDEILIEDDVFMWRADGDEPKSGGIVAKGEILSSPQNIGDDAPELWKKEELKGQIQLRVIIKLLEKARLSEGEGMIKRVDLEKDPKINNMEILTFRNKANFKLEEKDAQYINQLWKQKRTNQEQQ